MLTQNAIQPISFQDIAVIRMSGFSLRHNIGPTLVDIRVINCLDNKEKIRSMEFIVMVCIELQTLII